MNDSQKKGYEKILNILKRKKTYIDKKYYQDLSGTLNPQKCHDTKNKDDIEIRSDIFGAITENYFQSEKRICFILKESWTTEDVNVNGYLGGNNQTELYNNKKFSELGNSSYENIVITAYHIYKGLQSFDKDWRDKEKEAIDIFRNNVCVINANCFPSIGSKSNNSLIDRWAQKNTNLMQQQIDLYKPNFFIGGHAIYHFLNKNEKILFNEEVNYLYPDEIKKLSRMGFGDHNYTYYNKNHLYIDAYHPGTPGLNIENYCNDILSIINWWQNTQANKKEEMEDVN